MNPFEQYTLIIGALAVLIEGFSYLRDFVHKLLHPSDRPGSRSGI